MARIAVGDISINREVAGEGTGLVLIHGLGSDLTIWDDDAEVFAGHHRVLRPDVRGFGLSDKPSGPYSPELLAADIAGLMTAEQMSRAHIAGISMGGVIAQRLALDFPERVSSLILISTSSEVGEQAAASWHKLADAIERRGFSERTADASRAFSAAFGAEHPDVVEDLGRRNAANEPRAYAAAARAVGDYRWTSDLHRVAAPVLILQGLEDQLTPPGGSVKMQRALPCARLLMVRGAGHNLPLERPELFRSTLLAFTAGIDLSR